SFSDQILIEKLADRFVNPGDSGSLVVVERGGRMFPAGIAFGTSTRGRSPRYAVAAPLEHVLAGLSADTGGAPEILV
ncbi:MAG: hypothetical protein JNL98_36580, partial [Bryobacterales bacterium]|nr:hypothetical protein [Bryobacterales bacterium]